MAQGCGRTRLDEEIAPFGVIARTGALGSSPLHSSRPAELGDCLRGKALVRRQRRRTIAPSPIWRSGCQGAGVEGHCVVGGAGVCVVAVRGAVRAFAGFATFGHAHIRGLGPKTFVRRTSAV